MSTKILDLIAQLEVEIAESPKPKVGGAHKRLVDFDRIMDLIGDIRVTIPDEVRVAQSVLNEREMLLGKANTEAKNIYDNAVAEREKMISQEEIMHEAQERAHETTRLAKENARTIALGACNYADDILSDLQRYIHDYSTIIESNREELHAKYVVNVPSAQQEEETAPTSDLAN